MVSSAPLSIVILPGDGLGPQRASYARKTLELIAHARTDVNFNIVEAAFGGAAIENGQNGLPAATRQACQTSDAVLVCGCGDSRFGIEPEKALLRLRQDLKVFANIRRVRFPSTSLAQLSSYKSELVENLDITFVRDLVGGVYYGKRQEEDDNGYSFDTTEYSREDVKRLARWAAQYASSFSPPKAIHSVDKANVMATSRMWRRTVQELFDLEYPALKLDHVLVDDAAMQLAKAPEKLNGIILTENMFGDILSDQANGILSSQTMLASAALSTKDGTSRQGVLGIFEPLAIRTAAASNDNPLCILYAVQQMLSLSLNLGREAEALSSAITRTIDPVELIGSNVRTADLGGDADSDIFVEKVLENLGFFLEALNSADETAAPLRQLNGVSDKSRRPMGIIEKILTHSAVGLERPEVKPGDLICVAVDWTITSELLWAGMEKTYDLMQRPRLHRNDRLWLAVDHTVDPRTIHRPRQQNLIAKAERLRREAKIIDFLPANTSIMHTDFTRDRAQPGYVIVGSDSHTCSAGSMGALAVGFGAADVVMPMVTGDTWFRVPEVCRINFVGQLPFGVSGKDVVLHILGLFRRNTIAFQRAVEYGGPGLKELSMDARFAIANMCTEFGGMGACFEADEVTASWISRRKLAQHKDRGIYFRPDPDAVYAEERTIDLSTVAVTIGLYPNPDDVVPITAQVGMKLDGCFIGACTTTEEDLIVGALVIEAGLRLGMVPLPKQQRRVTPGSLIIIKNLEKHGLLDIYRRGGFEIGAPGCSYCVGINDVDVAQEGEVWLSSQNRNFRNRMGKGSFGHITCAAAVAASSFSMEVTDPAPLMKLIDRQKYQKLVKGWKDDLTSMPITSEPQPILGGSSTASTTQPHAATATIIQGKVQRFGENIDTDAIIPAEFMPGIDNADLGSHCFEYFRPEFRNKTKAGSTIVVAGNGFGSGSSREDAVRALQGSGVSTVVAKSFAFIYERNQLNMGLYNIVLRDEDFYQHATEDAVITIDRKKRTIEIDGLDKIFSYSKSPIEESLLEAGGVFPLYQVHGREVFRNITKVNSGGASTSCGQEATLIQSSTNTHLEW